MTRKIILKVAKRKAEILSAAMDAFAEKGYHQTKIADIAQRLKMGHGTFYRYFRNKLDIFSEVIEQIIERVKIVVEEEDPQSTNSAEEYQEQIQRIGNRLYEVFMEDMRMARIVFYEAIGVDPSLNEKINNLIYLVNQYVALYLQNGVDKGFLKKDLDIPVVAMSLNALILAGAHEVLEAENPKDASARWSQTVSDLVINGMAVDKNKEHEL